MTAAGLRPELSSGLLSSGLRAGDRRALARAITLVESTRADHRAAAEALLAELMPAAGGAIRLGISGVPGVGKSTFIERFGLHLVGAGHRVAVLAVDPSSRLTGGAILGDKTRMPELSRHPAAFIRPSPSRGTLGGVARRTAECIPLVEAAGYDVVLVETVGVGQSEIAVADMTDQFLLLLPPAGGDDLQGIKKGIVELADLVVVNKADGDLMAAAGRAAADYRSALQLVRPAVRVLTCSAVTGAGIAEVWDAIRAQQDPARVALRRQDQARRRLWQEVMDGITDELRRRPEAARLEAEVAAGRLSPSAAARRLLAGASF